MFRTRTAKGHVYITANDMLSLDLFLTAKNSYGSLGIFTLQHGPAIFGINFLEEISSDIIMSMGLERYQKQESRYTFRLSTKNV